MDVSPSAWRPFPGLSDVTSAKTAQNRMCSAHPKKKCLRPGSAWKIAWDSLGSERGKTAPFARIAFACRRGRTLDPPGRSGEGPGRQQHLLLPQRAWRDKPTVSPHPTARISATYSDEMSKSQALEKYGGFTYN